MVDEGHPHSKACEDRFCCSLRFSSCRSSLDSMVVPQDFQSFSETCSSSAKDPVGISHLATHVLDRWCSKGGIVFPRSEVGDSSHCDFVPCSFRPSSALSIEEIQPTPGVSYTQCRFARSRATKHQGFKQGFCKFLASYLFRLSCPFVFVTFWGKRPIQALSSVQ